MGQLAAQRRLHRAEQELAEAENALVKAEAEPVQRKRHGVHSPQGAAGRTRAGRVCVRISFLGVLCTVSFYGATGTALLRTCSCVNYH